ncbi:hypothetical protein GCM10010393_30030 [Streptomyces gobitricini]|uniref:Uncharacterized protein n=1 Tax=Streptomyces gobitricini TaxID=68211 RepID=A0ABP5ZBB3_9ACTN
MPGRGYTWCKCFAGLPEQARAVRGWTALRIPHADAPLIAHQLFVAALGSRPDAVEMTLSTADRRVRITAAGPSVLSLLQCHGPGSVIVRSLSTASGVDPDGRAMWAELCCATDV